MKIDKFNENNNNETFSVDGIKKLLKLLNVDVMYHEEHKEYFCEAYTINGTKTIWLNDFSDINLAAKKYNI